MTSEHGGEPEPAPEWAHEVPAPTELAAGGLLWRGTGLDGEARAALALVHRPRYDDWSLPKGKLDPGESWEQAALREVREETGWDARLLAPADTVSYLRRGRPKLVVFFHLQALRLLDGQSPDADEVDRLEWLTPEQALARLSYERERRLLADALARGEQGGV